jgi:hypothetical protein
MSRRLFAFLLSELKTLRLVCKNPACGNVAELTPERLASGQYASCPFCTYSFITKKDDRDTYPLVALAHAILAVRDLKKNVEVEFIAPDQN